MSFVDQVAPIGHQQRAQQLFRLSQMKKNWADYMKEATNELWLCLLRLDPDAIKFLLEKWAILREKRRTQQCPCSSIQTNHDAAEASGDETGVKRLEKLQLFECRFADEKSVNCLIQFMIVVGEELKELDISDAFLADEDDFVLDERSLVSLLCGLRKVSSLERLGLSHAFLRGAKVGAAFQSLLQSTGSHIRELRLWGCKSDIHMFDPFMVGLRGHKGLTNLCLMDSGVDDFKFDKLVQTIRSSNTRKTLRKLDLSKNRMTQRSLLGLSQLLSSCQKIESLLLNECRRLCGNVDSEPLIMAWYEQFLLSLGSNKALKELGLCSCGISNDLALPLFKILEGNSTLKRLDIRGIEPVSKALSTCLSSMRGLEDLSAHLDLEFPPLRTAIHLNTSLVELNCMLQRYEDEQNNSRPGDDEIWCSCSDKYVCRVLRRNRSLKCVPKFLIHFGTGQLDPSRWPICARKLIEDCQEPLQLTNCFTQPCYIYSSKRMLRHGEDASALYEFIRSTSLDMVSMYRGCYKM